MKMAKILLLLSSSLFCAASQPAKVIIFPLDNLSRIGTLGWLNEGIAMSVSQQLRSRNVMVVDRAERIDLVESIDLPPGARISRASMIRVAQQAAADLIVMGDYAGTEQNLKITIRVLDMRTLKLSGDMVANGSLAVLQQMENTLAWLILSNTSLEKALSRDRFEERARRIPNSPYSYYIQSLNLSDENEQIKLLQKAVGLFNDFPEAQFRLGYLYYRKGDCGSAMPHLMLGRSGESTYLENEFMSGTCYLQGDQPAQAVQSFTRILTYHRSFEILNNLAVAHLRRGDHILSLSSLLEARNLARTDPTVALNLAIVRHIQGNDPAARGVLEDAIKTHSKNGMLQFLYSIVLRALGESEKAATAANRAKSLGIDVEKLQAADPGTWSRPFSTWDHPGAS